MVKLFHYSAAAWWRRKICNPVPRAFLVQMFPTWGNIIIECLGTSLGLMCIEKAIWLDFCCNGLFSQCSLSRFLVQWKWMSEEIFFRPIGILFQYSQAFLDHQIIRDSESIVNWIMEVCDYFLWFFLCCFLLIQSNKIGCGTEVCSMIIRG